MLALLSRAISTLTGHPILPRWIQDITGGAGAEEGVYHTMDADGTTAARGTRVRADTGVVVAVEDNSAALLVNGHRPRPQTNPLQ